MADAQHPSGARNQAPGLIVLIGALLVVGVIAQEVVRHAIQAAPAFACLLAALMNVRATKWAALAVYLFWTIIALLIWLFLLHLSNVAQGSYTPAEIAMTVLFVLAGLFGVIAGWRRQSGLGPLRAAAVFVAAFAVQVLVTATSFEAPWAHDAQFCSAFNAPQLCQILGSAPH